MKGTLSRVSKFGFQTEETGSEKWANVSKYTDIKSVDGYNKGDVVEYEVNAKGYLTKLSKASGESPAPAKPDGGSQEKHQSGPSASSDGGRGARQTAVNAAFAEPLRLLASAEGVPMEEAVEKAERLAERLVAFITTGAFPSAPTEGKQ